jgi:hypothetical protein
MGKVLSVKDTKLGAAGVVEQSGGTIPLPLLIDRATTVLANAKSAAEVLEARDMASIAYDMAKATARLGKAKQAHDELIAAAPSPSTMTSTSPLFCGGADPRRTRIAHVGAAGTASQARSAIAVGLADAHIGAALTIEVCYTFCGKVGANAPTIIVGVGYSAGLLQGWGGESFEEIGRPPTAGTERTAKYSFSPI